MAATDSDRTKRQFTVNMRIASHPRGEPPMSLRAALPDAAFLGDLNKIRELLNDGADVDAPDEFGCVAFFS